MKRAGNLYEAIADPENLRMAFIKAKRGKEFKADVVSYAKNLTKNLSLLRDAILSEDIALGKYHFFTIYEPKERLICAATFSDRVLHHAIINVCHPFFERFQIYDSYATRCGKGQYAALQRGKDFQKKYAWFCKLDVRKYFDSIDHAILPALLAKRFKDRRLLSLFDNIIKSYHTLPGKGLPIGNLTSQYFANFYLAHADHFIKETLKAPAYVRYMDDMVFWGHDITEVKSLRNELTLFLKNKLLLEVKPDCMNRSEKGLPFLGYVLFDRKVRLNKQSKNRFLTKMGQYQSWIEMGIWDQKDFACHVVPLIAFTRHADAHNLRLQHFKDKEAGSGAPTA